MFERTCPSCKEIVLTKHKSKHDGKVCRRCSNTGRITSDSAKEKQRAAKLGKPLSDKHKENIAKGNTGRIFSIDTRIKLSINRGGDGKPHKRRWTKSQLQTWGNRIKKRDEYICQRKYDGLPEEMEAHHIIPKSKFPQYVLENQGGQQQSGTSRKAELRGQ